MSRPRTTGLPLLAVLASLAACTSLPPQILTIAEQEVSANETLQFTVDATDADTDQLAFSMRGAPKGAKLSQIAGRIAKFTWTPDPSQVGVHTITFVASDGANTDEETTNIKVTGGGGPELTSTDRYAFNLQIGEQPKFVLEYADDTTTELTFDFEPDPASEWGAEVRAVGKKVNFAWEPNDSQRAVAQHVFKITATNPDGLSTENTISIIFRGVTNNACPSGRSLPSVLPNDVTPQVGEEDYAVSAEIADEDGSEILYAVIFYTTVPEPAEADWQHATMTPGERAAWNGTIPNLQLSPGESATVTWHICAMDDDDPDGDRCDNWSCSEDRTFTTSAALGLCDPCEAGQCGESLCLVNATRGEKFCGALCGANDACPNGFYCATIDETKQCIPNGCRAGPAECSCASGRPVAPSAGELVVNEILFDPPDACPDGQTTCDASAKLSLDVNGDGVRKKDESEEEFVELLNVSAKYLQLEGVTVADGLKVRFTFPALVLPPNRAVVIFGGGDATKFASFGGAFKFGAAGSAGGSLLELNNTTADKVVLKLGGTTLNEAAYTPSSTIGKGQSLVRQREGDAASAFQNHTQASGASGAKWSPGSHTCGVPYPLDAEACIAPSCSSSNTNVDKEPENNARSTAACVKPLPQSVAGTLAMNQADASRNDPRDIYAIDGSAGRWLHARTEPGAAPALNDTIIRLLARNGSVIDTNDDDPWNTTSFLSRLITELPSDGVYYLEVTPYVSGTTPTNGSYRLVVETSATQPQKP